MSAGLTSREREYLDCEQPEITKGEAARGLIAGFLIGLVTAAFTPGNDKGDSMLIKTSRRMRYTRYKKAVRRKLDGTLTAKDEKLLKKLNADPFIYDLYDPDEFVRKIYEERMKEQ